MTNLFREKREWFRYFFFPTLMKAIGSYVTQYEAGERLASVVTDDVTAKSGIYWSWCAASLRTLNAVATAECGCRRSSPPLHV